MHITHTATNMLAAATLARSLQLRFVGVPRLFSTQNCKIITNYAKSTRRAHTHRHKASQRSRQRHNACILLWMTVVVVAKPTWNWSFKLDVKSPRFNARMKRESKTQNSRTKMKMTMLYSKCNVIALTELLTSTWFVIVNAIVRLWCSILCSCECYTYLYVYIYLCFLFF